SAEVEASVEQGPGIVARLPPLDQFRKNLHFGPDRDVEGLRISLLNTVENGERRRIVSKRLSQNLRSALFDQHRKALRIFCAPAKAIPRLRGRRARQHPSLRGGH